QPGVSPASSEAMALRAVASPHRIPTSPGSRLLSGRSNHLPRDPGGRQAWFAVMSRLRACLLGLPGYLAQAPAQRGRAARQALRGAARWPVRGRGACPGGWPGLAAGRIRGGFGGGSGGSAAAGLAVVLAVEGRAVFQDGVELPGFAVRGVLDPELVLLGVAAGGVALVGHG